MIVVGITGGIGSGKTSVCKMLEEHGIPIIYADAISREIVLPDMPLNKEIRKKFGDEAMLPDGNINRAYLRNLLITDESKRDLINKTFAPFVKQEFLSRIKSLKEKEFEIIGIENALIFESGDLSYYDKIVLVSTDKDNQIKRVINRDSQTKEAAEGMVALQMDSKAKEERSDYIIKNNSSMENLKIQVKLLFDKLENLKDE